MQSASGNSLRPLAVAAVFGGWLILLSAGWWVMTAYGFKRDATTSACPPSRWPAESKLPRTSGHDTLLVFLHPKCPCSRATVAELERLFGSRNPDAARPLQLCIVPGIPQSAHTSWAESSLIERCMKLEGAQLHIDRGGGEATRFGAEISGTVMLFDAGGALRYAGGVTMSRGHEGDNPGRDTLARVLVGEQHAGNAPAFGCRLVLEHGPQVNEVAAAVAAATRTSPLRNIVQASRRSE